MNLKNRKIDQCDVLSTDTEAAFERLNALIAQESQNFERNVYDDAIETLKLIFVKFVSEQGATTNPHTALGWVEELPDQFVRLLKAHSDLALVITSFYCVVLHRVPDVWWLKGWSRGLIRVLWQNVKPEYQKEMSWAREQVGIEFSVGLSKI